MYTLSVVQAGYDAVIANANRHDTANYDEPTWKCTKQQAKFVSMLTFPTSQGQRHAQFILGVILPLHIADIIHTTSYFFFYIYCTYKHSDGV